MAPNFSRLYRSTGAGTAPTALRLTWTGVCATDTDGILTRARLVWRRR